MSDAAISLAVLAVVVVLFVWHRLPVEVVAVGSALVLYGAGVIGLPDALAGFADPTVVLIGALFIVSEGLDATGVTTWVGQTLLARTGGSQRTLFVLVMLLAAGLTALINLNGSVAALLPMVVVVAVRQGIAPSKLLMPLAFAGSAGSLLLLTGSPVNMIIADAARDAGVGTIGFAEFALAGVPVVVGAVLILTLLGDRLLPERVDTSLPRDLSVHADTLVREYSLDHVVYLNVGPESALVGRPRGDWARDEYPDITVVTVTDAASHRPISEGSFAVGDRLTIVGDEAMIRRFSADHHLEIQAVRGRDEIVRTLMHQDGGVVEVVVPPRSRFLGETVGPGQVVLGGSMVVLAVKRQGRNLGAADTALQTGDVLLIEGPWEALDDIVDHADLLIVDSPGYVRRQAVPLAARSKRAIAVVVVMVVLLASGAVPAVVAALLAAGAMITLRVLSVQQAYRRISWTTLFLVAGIIPLSTAIRQSGAGELVAELIVGAVGGAGPLLLLIALFVLTVTFGQLISNTATALIMIPIAVSAAAQVGVSARPVLMSVCVASAAAFLTPVATPANMMVMGPAGYRFGDYWKLGLPMIGLFFVVAVLIVPLIWRF